MMHTPGPWKYVESLFHWIRAGDNTPIAIMKTPGPNVVANATLIAAAPELLEALEGIMECPYLFDEATIPKAGIAAAPNQVVVNMSVGWPKIQAIKNAVAKAKGTP